MKAIEIAPQSYWIGKIDDRKVPFHRLTLEKGTTYNSYLLKTEKPTIIDTVDILFGKEFVDNLKEIIDPSEIQYIIINHVEPDHAGALPALAAQAPNAQIVTTALGAELLKDMFKLHHREYLIIKEGDTLDIGGKTLKFFETPYLHTEETMVTYCIEDKILYPCDQFSTHIATKELFNDLAKEEYEEDYKVYYQLIMHPHRSYVRDMLKKIKDLPVKMIAPSHGYILRENAQKYIQLYDEYSNIDGNAKDKKVVIAYSTMTGNTTKIVQRIVKGLEEMEINPLVFNLKNAQLEDVKSAIQDCDGLLVGSSTKYADMVGNVEELLTHLADEEGQEKLAAAFGSYGWSGEGIVHVEEHLEKLGFTTINQNYLIKTTGMEKPIFPLRIQFSREEEMERAQEAGRIFGELLAK
ncbi:FprA family A-type flavoprotein [Irregularibacter muris]|uniref:FprA family A-type flavoprotein n=1 Tax=Irregularibacter muris TaxID=1796619 RepID=A0AAE3HCD6_9FIRM|nr:FprA family A-type flavoprotein [Irregularibacter muris]MCR1897672.1 FprA family A-type flavoprotein [Irregularibacter muris]